MTSNQRKDTGTRCNLILEAVETAVRHSFHIHLLLVINIYWRLRLGERKSLRADNKWITLWWFQGKDSTSYVVHLHRLSSYPRSTGPSHGRHREDRYEDDDNDMKHKATNNRRWTRAGLNRYHLCCLGLVVYLPILTSMSRVASLPPPCVPPRSGSRPVPEPVGRRCREGRTVPREVRPRVWSVQPQKIERE